MAGDIGTRIKRARERKRWSQRELAAALGVDRKTVDNWENGRTRPASSIGALEHVLGISLAEDAERSPPTAIDREFGDKAGDFREAMARVFGADAARKLRLVEEALSQLPEDGGAPRGQRAQPGPR